MLSFQHRNTSTMPSDDLATLRSRESTGMVNIQGPNNRNFWFILNLMKLHFSSEHTEASKMANTLQTTFSNALNEIRFCISINISLKFDMNSLGPSDAIWRWRAWSTLVQVMACCLTAPSHYLNLYWLIIRKVLWHEYVMNKSITKCH